MKNIAVACLLLSVLSSCGIKNRIYKDAQEVLNSTYSDLNLTITDGYNAFLNSGQMIDLQKFNLYLSDNQYPTFRIIWNSNKKDFENLRFMYDYNRLQVLKDSLYFMFYDVAPNYSTLTFDADYSDPVLWKATIYMFETIEKDSFLYKLNHIKNRCNLFASKYRLPQFEAESIFVDTVLMSAIHHEYFFDRPLEEFSENDKELLCKYSSHYKYVFNKNEQGKIIDSLDLTNGWMARDTITGYCNHFLEKKYPENAYYKMHDISMKLDTTDFNALITDKYMIKLVSDEKIVEKGYIFGKYNLKTKETQIKSIKPYINDNF